MKTPLTHIGSVTAASLALFAIASLCPPVASAQSSPKFVVKPVAEKRLEGLPAGPLYWRIETFPSLVQAKAAEGPASLAAAVDGKTWLFTLGPQGGATPGGTPVAEIGPLPTPEHLPKYLLRINDAGGPPGAKTRAHAHPGSETFYVLQGVLQQKTPSGVVRIAAGQGAPGHTAGTPMQVASGGTSPLRALVMFVVDPTKPFSSPAKLE